ncbi:hypothetical protein Tco_0203063 [Tanacetum coccineum]
MTALLDDLSYIPPNNEHIEPTQGDIGAVPARAHGGDGGGEDPSRPPPTSFGCAGCLINRGKGKRKPNLGGVKDGRKTRERTQNQVLKDAVAANKGRPIEIGFEDRADNTVVPTGPYSTQ